MGGVLQFKKAKRTFEAYVDDSRRETISRLVGPDMSKTMGAGIARFDGCRVAKTVLCDELIVRLEGKFRLRVGEEVFSTVPGDVLRASKGMALAYEGDGRLSFMRWIPSIGGHAISGPDRYEQQTNGASHL